MKEFSRVTGYLRNYLSQNQYCQSLINANERCFQRLGKYLEEKEVDYSPDEANAWMSTHGSKIAKNDRRFFDVALLRLRDIYEYGHIQPEHETRNHQSYSILSDNWKRLLDNYLYKLGKELAPKTVLTHKYQCAHFLVYVQKQGAKDIDDITFDMLLSFYDIGRPCTENGRHQSNACISSMLSYFYGQGLLPYSFTIIIHYIAVGNKQGYYWNAVSGDAHTKITELSATQDTVDTNVLVTHKEAAIKFHKENEYSKTMVTAYNRAADLLIMFLEMNGYEYSPDIAWVWFSEVKDSFGPEFYTIRRLLCMIADYHETSRICPEKMYRTKPSAFDTLPGWCREHARNYVEAKTREGWKRSTLNMIRSSVGRFCRYLDSIGIRSFRELDASHVKQFHANDVHKTPQGKNAYNGRIRKFLIYLGEKGILKSPMLFVSLPRASAPRETIVVVLTEEEMMELNRCLENDDGPLSLRKKAMLLLGLKMGLRASDIINLKIDDVDWEAASIRFVQEKTSVEVNLPMPAVVGNALFRYITEERHKKGSVNIFLSEKAPYRPVSRQVCKKALDTALPNRKVEGSGFHVTRKTYATGLLKNGVGAGMVAEALGQRGTSSVHRYLSLDVDRMRMCSIPLNCFEVKGVESC